MPVLNSLFSALLMYSRLPAPQVAWEESNRRWALCFFPLIGGVIGTLLLGWYRLCVWLSLGEWFFGATATALPLLVTGGIHMDGFCDVCDAMASCGSKEKMLEIMNDSHIGAFAAFRAALYLLVQAGVMAQSFREGSIGLIGVNALVFVLSRALSGLNAVTLPSAKQDGSLRQFTRPAEKTVTVAVESAVALAAAVGMLLFSPVAGSGALLGAGIMFLRCRRQFMRQFGGITGDLAGYFLQCCELASAIGALLLFAIGRVLS